MPSIIHLLSQSLSNFLDRINWISHFDRSFEHPLHRILSSQEDIYMKREQHAVKAHPR